MIPKFPHDLVGPVVPDDVGGVLVVQGRSGWRLFVDSESIKQAVYVYRPVFDPDGVIVDLEVVMVNEAARGVPLSTHIVEGVLTSNVFVDHGTALDAANSVWRGEPVPTYHVERRGFHTGQPIVVHYEVATLRVENYLVQVSVDHTTVTQLASADTRFKLMAEASSSALVLLSLDSGSGAYLIVYANPAAFKDVPGLRIGANLPVSIDEIIVGSIEELRAGAIVRHLWTREVLVRRVVVEATITPVGTDELMLSWRELTSEQLAVAELERSDRVLQAIGAGAFGSIAVYEPRFL
ncbi:MAG: hypothetical protein WCI22_14750, partial [Actinomycetota bacterium]